MRTQCQKCGAMVKAKFRRNHMANHADKGSR